MKFRSVGHTGVAVTEIALGTWGLATGSYGKVEPERLEQVAIAAYENGVRTFDVAPIWGESERRIATALGEERMREVSIITRAGQVLDEEGRPTARFESEALIEQVDSSLERLGRSTIDVLLLHNPSIKVLQARAFQHALSRLTDEKKIQVWGASVGTHDEARMALKLGARVIGVVYHLLKEPAVEEIATNLKETGAGLIVRSPLCHGLLAGTWTAETRFADDDHRKRRWDEAALAMRIEDARARSFLVHDDVADLASAALRYVLNSHWVSCAAVGARTVAQIEHSVRAIPNEYHVPKMDLVRLSEL